GRGHCGAVQRSEWAAPALRRPVWQCARRVVGAVTAESVVVLPRGLNVGRANRVPMPALRAALTAAGAASVQTVLASGNVVFEAESVGAARDLVEGVLAEQFGVAVPVVARAGADLQRVLATDHFGTAAEDDARILVNFLARPPDPHR